MKPIQCRECHRGVKSVNTKLAHKFAREDGWIGANGYMKCPKCKQTNANKNYWVIRDIKEAQSREGRLWNVPVMRWDIMRERVG